VLGSRNAQCTNYLILGLIPNGAQAD